jgi:hypothetical protein
MSDTLLDIHVVRQPAMARSRWGLRPVRLFRMGRHVAVLG